MPIGEGQSTPVYQARLVIGHSVRICPSARVTWGSHVTIPCRVQPILENIVGIRTPVPAHTQPGLQFTAQQSAL